MTSAEISPYSRLRPIENFLLPSENTALSREGFENSRWAEGSYELGRRIRYILSLQRRKNSRCFNQISFFLLCSSRATKRSYIRVAFIDQEVDQEISSFDEGEIFDK